MEHTQKNYRLGIIGIAMIPISIAGLLAFSLVFLSAPIGLVCGIISARGGNKTLGITGAVINAALLIGLLVLWIVAAISKGD